MGWFHARTEYPRLVDAATFEDAARNAGMTLDGAQRAAAALLAHNSANVYLVGPAGRGKTWLLDTFTAARPPGSTVRMHWHEFLRDLHSQIRIHRDVDDALTALLRAADTLCFDEMHVDDPADGIYVDHLLAHINRTRVRLILTSNSRPAELMPNPLFHDAFLPTIAMLEKLCQMVELDAGVDYRTRQPHGSGFASGMWTTATLEREVVGTEAVNGRKVGVWDSSPEHIGVDFDQICGTALSATDYLDLAARFRSWTLGAVPDLGAADRDPALRFLHLIDVLYDADRSTTIESATPRELFGHNGSVPPGTPRLLSRLAALRTPARPPDLTRHIDEAD